MEAYFASEIDEDAIKVVKKNFGDKPVLLGDVRHLCHHEVGKDPVVKEEEMQKLGRIDLLIGGPPCNDLSLVNTSHRRPYSGRPMKTQVPYHFCSFLDSYT